MRRLIQLICLVTLLTILCLHPVRAAEPVTGAVNNWFSLSGATYVSVDMTPNKGEAGYHFYSLSPFFDGQSYGLYAGIQTNGNLGNGQDVGNLFVFSVWNATQAYPENGATPTPFGGEGTGYSLRLPYNWQVGSTYTVKIQREAFDSGANGYRWSARINGLKIGEILAPAGASLLKTGSAFHERYSGSTPSCSASSSNLEQASVTFSNLASDKSVGFYSSPAPNGIFASSACSPYIHSSAPSGKRITGFGLTQAQFDAIVSPGTATTTQPAPSTPSATSTAEPEAAVPVEETPNEVAAAEDTGKPTVTAETPQHFIRSRWQPIVGGVLAGGISGATAFWGYRRAQHKKQLLAKLTPAAPVIPAAPEPPHTESHS